MGKGAATASPPPVPAKKPARKQASTKKDSKASDREPGTSDAQPSWAAIVKQDSASPPRETDRTSPINGLPVQASNEPPTSKKSKKPSPPKKAPKRFDASRKGKKSSKISTWLKYSVPTQVWIGVLAIIVMGALKYYSEQSQRFGGFDSEKSSDTDGISHYEVLNVSPKASLSEIRKSYKKLARENHPDTCSDCEEKFQRISTAYQVLSDPTSRQAYDSADTDLKPISSEAIQLSAQNADQVLGGINAVVIIQVYNDWSYESNAFANMWERAIDKLGSYMTFARLHEVKDKHLISKLIPVRTRLMPAIAVFVHGRFVRLLPTAMKYSQFEANLVASYPDKIAKLGTNKEIADFLNQELPNRIIIRSASGKVTMLLKFCALLFDGIASIGVTSLPPESINISAAMVLDTTQEPRVGRIADAATVNTNLLLSKNSSGGIYWRPIAAPSELVSMIRASIAGTVPTITSAWQFHGLCRATDLNCIVYAQGSKAPRMASVFVSESKDIRSSHLRTVSPPQFAIATLHALSDNGNARIVYIEDAKQMATMPKPIEKGAIKDWMESMVDPDRRLQSEFVRCPRIYATVSNAAWSLNWLWGILFVAVFGLLLAHAMRSGLMYIAVTVLIASSIIFQLDWLLPALQGLFSF